MTNEPDAWMADIEVNPHATLSATPAAPRRQKRHSAWAWLSRWAGIGLALSLPMLVWSALMPARAPESGGGSRLWPGELAAAGSRLGGGIAGRGAEDEGSRPDGVGFIIETSGRAGEERDAPLGGAKTLAAPRRLAASTDEESAESHEASEPQDIPNPEQAMAQLAAQNGAWTGRPAAGPGVQGAPVAASQGDGRPVGSAGPGLDARDALSKSGAGATRARSKSAPWNLSARSARAGSNRLRHLQGSAPQAHARFGSTSQPATNSAGPVASAAIQGGAFGGAIGAGQEPAPAGGTTGAGPGTGGGIGGGLGGGGGGKPPDPTGDFGLALNELRGQAAVVEGRNIARCLGAAFRHRYVEANSNLINLGKRLLKADIFFKLLPDAEIRGSSHELFHTVVGSDERAVHLASSKSHWTDHFVYNASDGLAPRLMNAALNAGHGAECLSRDLDKGNIDQCYGTLQASVDQRDPLLKEVEAVAGQVRERGEAGLARFAARQGRGGGRVVIEAQHAFLNNELENYKSALSTATKNIGGLEWISEEQAMAMGQSYRAGAAKLLASEHAFLNSRDFEKLPVPKQERLRSALATLNLNVEIAVTAWSDMLGETNSHSRLRQFINAQRLSQGSALDMTVLLELLFPKGNFPGRNPPGSQSLKPIRRSECDGDAKEDAPRRSSGDNRRAPSDH